MSSAIAIAMLALSACSPANQTPAASEPAPQADVAADEGGHGDVLLPQMVCGPDAFIKPDVTKASLIATHGAENVTEETVAWADSEETAVVLFANNPAMRVLLFWLGDTTPAASGYDGHFLFRSGTVSFWTTEQNSSFINENELPLLKPLRATLLRSKSGLPTHTQPNPRPTPPKRQRSWLD